MVQLAPNQAPSSTGLKKKSYLLALFDSVWDPVQTLYFFSPPSRSPSWKIGVAALLEPELGLKSTEIDRWHVFLLLLGIHFSQSAFRGRKNSFLIGIPPGNS